MDPSVKLLVGALKPIQHFSCGMHCRHHVIHEEVANLNRKGFVGAVALSKDQ